MDNIVDQLEYLFALERRGIKVGLEHTYQLLGQIGNPQQSFNSIHVAGTNGKGSTCANLASILKNANYTVGLYTSPHLVHFNERIRVNGLPIPDDYILKYISRFRQHIEAIKTTFFEATTAMAFWYFEKRNVDIAIVETGLGGRLDSTNVLNPIQTIITPIAFDHSDILGKTIEEIAFEKGGIIKSRIPLILAKQKPVVKKILLNIAKQKNSSVITCNNSSVKTTAQITTSTKFYINGIPFYTPLKGYHQGMNAVTSVVSINHFDPKIPKEVIQNGLSNVFWPGRLQQMDTIKPIYYDVAHNAHGIHTILHMFRSWWKKKPIGILALKTDKNINLIAPILKDSFSELIVTSFPDTKTLPAETLRKTLIREGIPCTMINDVNIALTTLKENVNNNTPGLIFGSHYIANTVFEYFSFSFDNGFI